MQARDIRADEVPQDLKSCGTSSCGTSSCGTSIGANVREAQSAESRADFIHKLKISAKECEETKYWLMLCNASENYPKCFDLINFCDELGMILTKIISSARRGR